MLARAGTAALAALATLTAPAFAQEHDADELARQLSNPVADLISVPIQGNFDFGAGADNEGSAITINVQPVMPISQALLRMNAAAQKFNLAAVSTADLAWVAAGAEATSD